jgi:flagellar biosynthesis/type III secretory pathway protein FliH
MQTYLPTEQLVSGGEQVMEAIQTIEGTWLSRETKKAIQQGLQQGLQQGELKGKREIVQHLLQMKFGAAASPYVDRLQAIHDPALLDQLSEQVVFAQEVTEIKWPVTTAK